jgi:Fe-S oxidoreductase
MPDIDIDFKNRDEILSILPHRVARLETGKKHNTGIYPTEIPFNPIDNLATIDYKTAEERGYFKLDFLNVHIYKDIKDENHLNELMNREPLWELLTHTEFCSQVFHLSGNEDLVKHMAPKNVEQLAATLAIIRPSKRYLAKESWDVIFKEVWQPTNDETYYFKKAHSFSYAIAVIVHINLLCENLLGPAN